MENKEILIMPFKGKGHLKVTFVDGKIVDEPKVVDSFVNAIRHIAELTSYETIIKLDIEHDELPLIGKTTYGDHAVRIVGKSPQYRLLTGMPHPQKAEIIKEIVKRLDIDATIEWEVIDNKK